MYPDMFLLLVCLLSDFQERIEFDNASLASRKRTWMDNINLSNKESFLVFHGFTVNGYVSTFLQKWSSNLLESSS